MVKSNIINPNMQQPQPTIPEAVNALLGFMQQQMAINAEVRNNLALVENVLYRPVVKGWWASKHTCVEAIK